MKNRKKILLGVLLIGVLCCIGIVVLGMSQKKQLGPFTGSWQCADHPLETEEVYTGYLVLSVQSNGKFRMYDAEAGNPGISGRMDRITEQDLRLRCNTREDFDPPVTWSGMQKKQILSYTWVSDQELHLSLIYEEVPSTLIFTKME